MALTGWFLDPHESPFIESRVSFPRLGVSASVFFLVDTGADFSLLMPDDATNLGIDFAQLPPSTDTVGGVGSGVRIFREESVLRFADATSFYVYRTDLALADPNDSGPGIPSLLGRDILNRWLMRYEPPRNVLEAEVDSADLVIPRRS